MQYSDYCALHGAIGLTVKRNVKNGPTAKTFYRLPCDLSRVLWFENINDELINCNAT